MSTVRLHMANVGIYSEAHPLQGKWFALRVVDRTSERYSYYGSHFTQTLLLIRSSSCSRRCADWRTVL